eukprot:g12676.t1
MVAPKYGPTEPSPSVDSAAVQRGADKRRQQILQNLLKQAAELRLQGNQAFKKAQLDQAETNYSHAIHTLQKIPGDMAAPDLVKSLNNRGRVYVKLEKMEQAEIDASEVLSMSSVEPAATSAAFLVRYHARTGLGAPDDALGDLEHVSGGGGGGGGGGSGDGDGHVAQERAAAVVRVVAVDDSDIAAPPPERQAQLIRWMVAQAREEKHCLEGTIWAVLDKRWWERWQLYAGCGVDVADAAAAATVSGESGAGHAGKGEEGDDVPAGATGSAGATAQDAAGPAGNGAVAGGAAVGANGTPSEGGSATAEEEPAVTAAVEAVEPGIPHVSVGDGDGDAGGDGDGDGDGGGKGGGMAAKASGEARTNGDRKAAATAEATATSGSPVPHPGPIDNSDLVLAAEAPGTVPGTGRRLRLRLVRGYHFVLVPQEAWIALHAWYGGGPVLPRGLVSVRDSDSGDVVLEPQLYPEFSRLDPVLSSSGGSSRTCANGSGSSGPVNNADADTGPGGNDAVVPPPAERREGAGKGEEDGGGGGGGGLIDDGSGTGARPGAGEIFVATASEAGDQGPENGGGSSGGGLEDGEGGEAKREEGEEGGGEGAEEGGSRRRTVAVPPCAACGLPAGKKCGSCFKTLHRVWYCSQACQKAHWRFHRRFCGGKHSEAGVALAKRGKAGLDNLGNTCFLNSAVQCLSHVQPLTRHLLSNAFREDLNVSNPLGTGGRLVQAYEQVLKDLWFGSRSSVSPVGLKSAIAKFAPQFNGYSQQDSQEVLSFLLDGLHEDLNRVLKKPYLTLPDGECGRPDSIIAAESWKLFSMRDRSVLVESLYGQFKSTLECGHCGKLSRKFDEFNVMPVEIQDGQRLCVVLDFAPLLNPSAAPTSPAPAAAAAAGGGAGAASAVGGDGPEADPEGTRGVGASCPPRAAWLLSGGVTGAESRKQRRVGLVVPKEALVSDLKAKLAEMLDITPEEMVIVVMPTEGRKATYRILPDSTQVSPFIEKHEITAHECVPGQRHALVVNRVFEGGRHVAPPPEGRIGVDPLVRWAEEVSCLSRLRHVDRLAPFLVSFPDDVSCLGLLEIIWDYMRDYLHLTQQEYDDDLLGHNLASSGHIKVSEASDYFAPYDVQQMAGERQAYEQDRSDAENGVVVTEIGRYVPPTNAVRAAAVLDNSLSGRGQQQGVEYLDFLHLDWCGFLLNNLNESRIDKHCFGEDDHPSVKAAATESTRVSLQDCLEKFSVPETLCEDNSWYCSRCKELRQAVKTIQVWSLPEVLILHFKRFSHAGPNRGKVELRVDFPINGLDMSPYCRGETLEGGRPMSALYDLFAVSNHLGGMGHGHYTAFVRDWEGSGMSERWHVCDDHECRPVADESGVCSPEACEDVSGSERDNKPEAHHAGGKAECCLDHAEDGMVNVIGKRCTHHGCTKQPSYGKAGGKAECCHDHAEDGMVNMKGKRCSHHGCTKHPSFGKAGGKAECCLGHAEDGMVNMKGKRCSHHSCTKQPSYGKAGGKAECCHDHAKDGMVNVTGKRCTHHGCTKHPSYGKAGGKAECCLDHAEDGMVNMKGKRCSHHGCTKQPSYGKAGGKAECCLDHAEDGMVNMKGKRCSHHGCTKHPSFGKTGGKAECCHDHAKDGMVNVIGKRCTHHGCSKQPSYGKAGANAECCHDHAEDGMVNVRSKRCSHHGCTKRPSFGKAGGKAECCLDHAEDGMVNVVSKRCSHHGCTKQPSYGKAGGKAECCHDHAEDGMVNVVSKRCSHHGCTKRPSFGKAGGKAECCLDHAEDGMVNVRSKRCPHNGCTKGPSSGLAASGMGEFLKDHSDSNRNRKPSRNGRGGGESSAAGLSHSAVRRAGTGEKCGRTNARSSAATKTPSSRGRQASKRARRIVNAAMTPTPFAPGENAETSGIAAPSGRDGRTVTSARDRVGVPSRAATATGMACETEVVVSSPLACGSTSNPAEPRGRRKRSKRSVEGAGATDAEEEEEEEEAATSASAGGAEAANTNGGRARRTAGKAGAAAVLARVTLSCKTEPREGGEGGGPSSGRSPSFGTAVSAGCGAPVVGVPCKQEAIDPGYS